jgi:hypothetical protein
MSKNPVFLRRTELFNTEFCDYNPLFVNQGDSSSASMAFRPAIDVARHAVDVDAAVLSGVALGAVVADHLKRNPKADPRDFNVQVSALAGDSAAISTRVHKTLPVAPQAYESQIKDSLKRMKSNSKVAKTVLLALDKKGLSKSVVVETIKMIERGVPVGKVKNEVVSLFKAASALKGATPVKTGTPKSISPAELGVDAKSTTKTGEAIVSKEEASRLASAILGDPVINKISSSAKVSVATYASKIADAQVDEILKSLSIKAIVDGSTKAPSDTKLKAEGVKEIPPVDKSITDAAPGEVVVNSGWTFGKVIGVGFAIGAAVFIAKKMA